MQFAPNGPNHGGPPLRRIPDEAEGELLATLNAVESTRPPFAFYGGLRWRTMRDEMAGYREARDEHDGTRYRLFVRFDRDAPGLPHSAIVVIDGDDKPDATAMPEHVYQRVRSLWETFERSSPRCVCD